MQQRSYETIRKGAQAEGEFVDRKSRFIAQIGHVEAEREANAFIDGVRAKHHDARHNVPAWILADGREKRSDDGEPQGTAGQPTLEVLRGAGLENVCCVTTRYFGGTLLGPGGLVRAYTAACQKALENAREQDLIVRMDLVTRVTAVIPYSAYGRVQQLVGTCRGKVRDTIFAEDVQLTAVFLSGDELAFTSAMRELAQGEDLCTVGEPVFAEF